jgi:hypothetical protein
MALMSRESVPNATSPVQPAHKTTRRGMSLAALPVRQSTLTTFRRTEHATPSALTPPSSATSYYAVPAKHRARPAAVLPPVFPVTQPNTYYGLTSVSTSVLKALPKSVSTASSAIPPAQPAPRAPRLSASLATRARAASTSSASTV